MMKIKNKINDPAARLKKIRLYLGKTQKQFGEIINISQFTIRSWENGAKNFTADGVQRVISVLDKNLNFMCTFDWLMYGKGSSPISLYEEKDLYDIHDVEIDSLEEKLLKEIIIFKRQNKYVNVLIVSDDTFSPIAEIGDYVGLLPIDMEKFDAYVGKLIYLSLQSDTSIFGVLNKRREKLHVLQLINGKSTSITKNMIEKASQFIWFRKSC